MSVTIMGVASRYPSVQWGLILLAVSLIGLGAALVMWLPPLLDSSITTRNQQETAVVLTPANCSAMPAQDVVEINLDGHKRQAKLDGCGHRVGERVQVELPASADGAELLVRPARTTTAPDVLVHRLTTVLLALACIAGALYGFLLGGRLQFFARAKR